MWRYTGDCGGRKGETDVGAEVKVMGTGGETFVWGEVKLLAQERVVEWEGLPYTGPLLRRLGRTEDLQAGPPSRSFFRSSPV